MVESSSRSTDPCYWVGVGKGVMTELFHRLNRQLEGGSSGFSTVYVFTGYSSSAVVILGSIFAIDYF